MDTVPGATASGGESGGEITRDWYPVSFVSSTRDILARCMREKGCGPDLEVLLAGLPETFKDWRSRQIRPETADT